MARSTSGTPAELAPQDSTLPETEATSAALAEARAEADATVADLSNALSADEALAVEAGDPAEGSAEGSADAPKRVSKYVAVSVGAVLIATAVIIGANVMGGHSAAGNVPQSVAGPEVVVSALEQAGFDCRGSAVAGDVATCNSMIAVRVFPNEAAAQAWVDKTLKDPLTNSSVGWVRHGNAVVAAPLTEARAIAAALGPESHVS